MEEKEEKEVSLTASGSSSWPSGPIPCSSQSCFLVVERLMEGENESLREDKKRRGRANPMVVVEEGRKKLDAAGLIASSCRSSHHPHLAPELGPELVAALTDLEHDDLSRHVERVFFLSFFFRLGEVSKMLSPFPSLALVSRPSPSSFSHSLFSLRSLESELSKKIAELQYFAIAYKQKKRGHEKYRSKRDSERTTAPRSGRSASGAASSRPSFAAAAS